MAWLGGRGACIPTRTALDSLKKRLWGKKPGPPPADVPTGAPLPPPVRGPPPRVPPLLDVPDVLPSGVPTPRDVDVAAGPGNMWVVCETIPEVSDHPMNFGVTVELTPGFS